MPKNGQRIVILVTQRRFNDKHHAGKADNVVESAADIACVAANVQLIDESGSVVQPALYDVPGTGF